MRWVVAPWQRWEFRGRAARRCALRPLILQEPGRPEPWSELELLDGSGTIALVTDHVDVALGAKGIDALPDVPLMGRLGDAAPSDRAMLLDLLRTVGLTATQIKQALGDDTSAARFAALIDVLTGSTPTPSVDRNGEIVVDSSRRVARARPIPGLAAGGAFPTTGILSTFTGANGSAPAGMSDNVTGDLDSGLRIQGNQGTAGSGTYSGSYWSASAFGADQEAGMTLATRPTPNDRYSAVFLRIDSPASSGVDGYTVWALKQSGTDICAVERITNQSYTSVGGAISQEWSAGDKLGADMIGTTLTIYRQPSGGSWGVLGTRNDSAHQGSGYIGWESDDTTSRIDDAFGGTVATGPSVQTITGVHSPSAYTSHVGTIAKATAQSITGTHTASTYASRNGEVDKATPQAITGTHTPSGYTSHPGTVANDTPSEPQTITGVHSPSGYTSHAGAIGNATPQPITGIHSPSGYTSHPGQITQPTTQTITGTHSPSRYRSHLGAVGRPVPALTVGRVAGDIYAALAPMHTPAWPMPTQAAASRVTPSRWAHPGGPTTTIGEDLMAALAPMHSERWPDGE